MTPFKEEFPAFLLTISEYVSQTATDVEIEPSYRGHLASPVETRDLKAIEKALDDYDWTNAAWGISTRRIWEAFKIEQGREMTQFPNDDQIRKYIPLVIRQIHTYLTQAGSSPTQSLGVDAEGTDADGGAGWDSSAVHDKEPPAQDHSPSSAALPSRAPDTDGDSDDGVLPTMSGAINSSSRQGSADNQALTQLDTRYNELRTNKSELRAIVEALQERVQALERTGEVDSPSNETLIAENERLRRQRDALKALARRQVREIQFLRQQRT